jgi:hypothetical protein
MVKRRYGRCIESTTVWAAVGVALAKEGARDLPKCLAFAPSSVSLNTTTANALLGYYDEFTARTCRGHDILGKCGNMTFSHRILCLV